MSKRGSLSGQRSSLCQTPVGAPAEPTPRPGTGPAPATPQHPAQASGWPPASGPSCPTFFWWVALPASWKFRPRDPEGPACSLLSTLTQHLACTLIPHKQSHSGQQGQAGWHWCPRWPEEARESPPATVFLTMNTRTCCGNGLQA